MPLSLDVLTAVASVLGLTTVAFAALWWRARRLAGRTAHGVHPAAHGGIPDVLALFALRAEPSAPLGPRQQQAIAQLSQSLPGHEVLARVSLSSFLSVNSPLQPQWAMLVGQLHVDLLVCDAQARPAVAVDLTPAAEPAKAAQLRRQKMRVIESAAIATLILPAPEPLDVEVVRQILLGQGPQSRMKAAPSASTGAGRDGGKMAEAIPVAEAVEMSADDLPEFAPTTIFRPDDAVLPPKA